VEIFFCFLAKKQLFSKKARVKASAIYANAANDSTLGLQCRPDSILIEVWLPPFHVLDS